MELDDVGQDILLSNLRVQPLVKVIMGITAPRGSCLLFQSEYITDQVEAIKAFMEAHRND